MHIYLIGLASMLVAGATVYSAPTVSFRDEVLPLLSDRCFHCHGPDENTQEGDLRLDTRSAAIEDRGGYRIIAPGDSESSELIARIVPDDPDMVMPPPESGKPALTAEEVELFRRWIEQGAEYQKHWSFVRVERPTPPQVSDANWAENQIDSFVMASLDKVGLAPAPRAPKHTLLRRAALVLTGLPPSEELLEKYLGDASSDAYERAIDKLLDSPHYGERMAYDWLDAARYADTDGYQHDETRENWPWRDWVVRSYNQNMPFDQFTREQFAGDLLPKATADQIIATCFHRNHLTNGEGGRDPEESRVNYVLDRVNTLGTTWLGLTLGCCQCHSHKYDPISQHDYYSLTAFFNSIDESGRAGKGAKPFYEYPMPLDSPYQQDRLRPFREQLVVAEKRVKQVEADAFKRFDEWLLNESAKVKQADTSPIDWRDLQSVELRSSVPKLQLKQDKDGSISVGQAINPDKVDFYIASKTPLAKVTALRLEALPHPSHTAGGLSRSDSGNINLTDVEIRIRNPGQKDSLPIIIASAEADFEQPGYSAAQSIDDRAGSGWAVWSGDIAQKRTLVMTLVEPVEITEGALLVVRLKHQSKNPKHYLGHFRLTVTDVLEPTLDQYRDEPLTFLRGENALSSLSVNQRGLLLKYFLDHDGQVGSVRGSRTMKRLALEQAEKNSAVKVMVLRERPRQRKTYVLERGQWDQHGDEVSPNTPEVLGKPPAGSHPDRLALANWLVGRDNPLTARVTVNRYWQKIFGAGLVRTPEDFGLQGERPTHPKLLDWLAAEFIESGWDVKYIHRLIVTSATFQQASHHRPELRDRDPENRLLARGPRFRLPAPLIRDQALAASGLLVADLGGAPVFPYQPRGVWFDASQGRYKYQVSQGDRVYRRSLYAFWRRNAAPPTMFDSADRRVCQVGVVRTNSPMHALNLLNDVTYVEAARSMAEAAYFKGGDSLEEQIQWAYRRVVAREADKNEMAILAQGFATMLDRYKQAPEEAQQLLMEGQSTASDRIDPVRLAAMTAIMNILLNLDETLNLE